MIADDFLTNNRVISFVIIVADQFTEDIFLSGIGMVPNAPILPLLREIFNAFKIGLTRGHHKSHDQAFKDQFCETTQRRIEIAEKRGEKVLPGSFYDDISALEAFLVNQHIVVDTEKLFIDTRMADH